MIYQTAEECRRGGGACPRLCMDQGAGVECATRCYQGCYCPDGLFLQNGSCVPQSQCLCYHRGALYQPGDTAPRDACNNWYGAGVRGARPCCSGQPLPTLGTSPAPAPGSLPQPACQGRPGACCGWVWGGLCGSPH